MASLLRNTLTNNFRQRIASESTVVLNQLGKFFNIYSQATMRKSLPKAQLQQVKEFTRWKYLLANKRDNLHKLSGVQKYYLDFVKRDILPGIPNDYGTSDPNSETCDFCHEPNSSCVHFMAQQVIDTLTKDCTEINRERISHINQVTLDTLRNLFQCETMEQENTEFQERRIVADRKVELLIPELFIADNEAKQTVDAYKVEWDRYLKLKEAHEEFAARWDLETAGSWNL